MHWCHKRPKKASLAYVISLCTRNRYNVFFEKKTALGMLHVSRNIVPTTSFVKGVCYIYWYNEFTMLDIIIYVFWQDFQPYISILASPHKGHENGFRPAVLRSVFLHRYYSNVKTSTLIITFAFGTLRWCQNVETADLSTSAEKNSKSKVSVYCKDNWVHLESRAVKVCRSL